MPTDDERREVAERLRAYGKEFGDATWRELCNVVLGDEDRYPSAVRKLRLIDRLADLIEPSCDREALLAQVRELEKCAWYFGLDFGEDEPLRDRLKEASEDFAGCARRIREACGEVVE